MRNLVIICLSMLVCSVQLFSQDRSQDKLIVKTSYHDGDVMIRWMPKNYTLWQEGTDHGYMIIRNTTDATGVETADTIMASIKPITESNWDGAVGNSDFAQSAKMMLYDETIGNTPDTINSLSDALELREEQESRYFFAMISAENDYQVAQALGLAYTDDDVNVGSDVYYTVVMNDPADKSIIGAGLVDLGYQPTSIQNLKATSSDGSNTLSWDFRAMGDDYSAWNIERSVDSISFVKINDLPYQHAFSEDKYEFIGTYVDDASDCTDRYYYRIQGITSFGIVGPYSNIVGIRCNQNQFSLPLTINGVKDMESYTMVNWDHFDDAYQDSIMGFNVYRTDNLKNPPLRLNATMLPNSSRSYDDMDNPGYAYYFLEAIDVNNGIHRSPESFFQRIDTIPPTAPSGLSGEFIDEQRVRLIWDQSQEDDLKGYDVYIANHRNGSFIKANKNLIKSPKFEKGFSKNISSDSIFVKIIAEDIFLNRSKYSDIIGLARPDIWGPVSPILKFAYPEHQGVALAWSYSPSDDVVKHIVQRRPTHTYTWTDLLIITNELRDSFPAIHDIEGNSAKANHIDDYELEGKEYFYRVIAIDDSDNETSSDRIKVKPFATKELNIIKDFSIRVEKSTYPPSQQTMDALTDMDSPEIVGQIKAMTVQDYKAALSWKADVDPTLESILIYRAASGDKFNVVKELSPEDAMTGGDTEEDAELSGLYDMQYSDDTVKKNKTYVYYIVGKYNNGAESEKSQIISIKIK